MAVKQVGATPAGSTDAARFGDLTPLAPKASPSFTGLFGLNTTATVRQPMSVGALLNGPTVLADTSGNDKVGIQQNIVLTGSFAGDTGGNAGFVWGSNIFLTTGTAASDGAGLSTLVGGIVEASVQASSGTFALVQGLVTGSTLSGPAAGATITQAESLRVTSPGKKDGATGGQITNAYGLFVEEVAAGSATNFSVFVAGGTSRFQGTVDVWNNVRNAGGGNLTLYAGFSTSDGATFELDTTGNGGNMATRLYTAGSAFYVLDSGGVKHSLGNDGFLSVGAYPDHAGGTGAGIYLANATTVPTGNPSGGGVFYVQAGALKYKGSSGTITTIGAA